MDSHEFGGRHDDFVTSRPQAAAGVLPVVPGIFNDQHFDAGLHIFGALFHVACMMHGDGGGLFSL